MFFKKKKKTHTHADILKLFSASNVDVLHDGRRWRFTATVLSCRRARRARTTIRIFFPANVKANICGT